MSPQALTSTEVGLSPFTHCDNHVILGPASSSDDNTPPTSVNDDTTSRSYSNGSNSEPYMDHVIKLSSIEAVMPRAYIRICFAYRVPDDGKSLNDAIAKLRVFVRSVVDAKPYLAGYVADVDIMDHQARRSDIRFSTYHYLAYPEVEVKDLTDEDGNLVDYDELDAQGCPPSRLRPDKVSALQENVGPEDRSAPTFRAQANVVRGGLIVSFWLHHCVSDGTGFDMLTTGDVKLDYYRFNRTLWTGENYSLDALDYSLRQYANQKTAIRSTLSKALSVTTNTRRLKARRRDHDRSPRSKPGRGCVVMISFSKIASVCANFNTINRTKTHTRQSVLMAILWRHMTRARRPSIASGSGFSTSKLFIPVDVRERMVEPLPAGYFGAAIDSATAELSLDSLTETSGMNLEQISNVIRNAVDRVDDGYVRECIAFANAADETTDISDIQASNMERATGADMYITSWLRLRSYNCDLGMGLGGPDWVRKPWSRDPGSCIILPQKTSSPDYYEVVIQMTAVDMERLLNDKEFGDFVVRVVD